MSSRLMVNLIEPSDIVIPDTDGGTPDTGIFSIGQSTNNVQNSNALIITVISLAVLLAIVTVIILLIKRHKKQKLVNKLGGSYNGMTLNSKRHLVPRLAGLFTLVLIAAFGFLNYNEKHMTSNVEAVSDTLTVTAKDITSVNIVVEDEAAFGVGESTVTVDTATNSGYTLMAYVDSTTTSLTNTESDDVIEMLETTYSQALTDNTWGIAFTKPESQDQTVFRGLPTAEKDAMIVNVSSTNPTEAGDAVTLYYAAYVTPDLEYGTYEGATINYIAVPQVIDTDDVTVRFHGNGFYFDEAKTQDTNTVVYGETCKLSYIDISGGCNTVYVGNDTKISKSPNINDDGVAEGGYDDYLDDDYLFVDHVSFDGADMLMIDLTYGLETDYDYLYVFESDDITKENWYNRREDATTVLNEYGDNEYGGPGMEDDEYLPAGETTLFINGDSVSFVLSTDGADDYYGYYANIHPVYLNKPEGIQTKEDKICHFVKSDNVNEDGEKEESYYPDANFLQTVSIPGADKIKVEINYAINTDGAEIDVVRGVWNGEYDDYSDERMVFSTYYNDADPTGSEEFIIDDGAVTFKMISWDELIEGYDYGFYARLYPIYAEEHEGTIPMQDCIFGRKGGTFMRVVAPEDYYEGWYLFVEIEGEDYYGEPWWFDSEVEILDYIMGHIDYYAGRTVDIYARNYYVIAYDANGGAPIYDDWNPNWAYQRVYEFYDNSIWDGYIFKREGYNFVSWNTRPDGSGDWYYPNTLISAEGHLGETLTLYAQWAPK